MRKILHTQKGFTLIETLVAIAIMSILILSVASMMATMAVQERRTKVINEVDTAASSIMDDITLSLRNATSITAPAGTTTSTTTMTLNMSMIAAENPTTFSLATSSLYATKGTSTYRMNNPNVIINSVSFRNISATSTDGSMRVALTVSYNNIVNDTRLNYSTTLNTSVSLR